MRTAAPEPEEDAPVPSTAEDRLAELEALGLAFRRAPISRTTKQGERCLVEDAVRFRRGASGVRYAKPVHVNTAFALRISRFEQIAQEEAMRWFRSPFAALSILALTCAGASQGRPSA